MLSTFQVPDLHRGVRVTGHDKLAGACNANVDYLGQMLLFSQTTDMT